VVVSSVVEVRLADPEDRHHMLRLHDHFLFRGHVFFVTELLGTSLYGVMKQNKFRGFSLSLLGKILNQILDCLVVLNEIGLIHNDLKPENILLDQFPHSLPCCCILCSLALAVAVFLTSK
jgi:serine/threonine protein kinase